LHVRSFHNSAVPSAASKRCSRIITNRNARIYVLYPLLSAANSLLPVDRKLTGKVLFSAKFSPPSCKHLAWGGLEDLLYSGWLRHK